MSLSLASAAGNVQRNGTDHIVIHRGIAVRDTTPTAAAIAALGRHGTVRFRSATATATRRVDARLESLPVGDVAVRCRILHRDLGQLASYGTINLVARA